MANKVTVSHILAVKSQRTYCDFVMNCDKKFLCVCRLETGGYALGLLHFGASVAAIVLFLHHFDKIDLNLWIIAVGAAFWLFHLVASVMLVVGTAKRKPSLIIPFIVLYTIIFTTIAIIVAFCALEASATYVELRDEEEKSKNVTISTTPAPTKPTTPVKEKMKAFKQKNIPRLKLDMSNHFLIIFIAFVICIFCVYILSCVCSLYDKLKEYSKERKCLPVVGNILYGAVKESDSNESY